MRKDPWLSSKYSKVQRYKEHTVDNRSRQSTGGNEETRSNLTNTHCTKGGRNFNNAPRRLKRKYKCYACPKRNEGWTPIYFVSRVLQGAELNYHAMEKLVLALVHAVRRLRRYFQAHMITVLINTPIKQMLIGLEKKGRIVKWEIELGEHDILFLRRNEKETPADFLVEIPFKDNKKKEKPEEVPDSNSMWRLYTHGASNLDGSGAWLMLIDLEGKEYSYA
ncbi:reverse transcriptase domain-containing protein [Tanacetum coccineum]